MCIRDRLAIVPNVPLAAPHPYPSKRFLKVEKLTLFIPIVFVEVESVFILFYFFILFSIINLRGFSFVNHIYNKFVRRGYKR